MWYKDVKIFMSYHRSFWVRTWEHRKAKKFSMELLILV